MSREVRDEFLIYEKIIDRRNSMSRLDLLFGYKPKGTFAEYTKDAYYGVISAVKKLKIKITKDIIIDVYAALLAELSDVHYLCNREDLYETVMLCYFNTIKSFDYRSFISLLKRMDFYYRYAHGAVPKMYYFHGDKNQIDFYAPLSIGAAFLDCLYNPTAKQSYDDAPFILRDITDSIRFMEDGLIPIIKYLSVYGSKCAKA